MGSSRANSAGLNELELTGRARTHVREFPALGCFLHPEAALALEALRAAASRDGLELQAVSGFRDFARQLAIWNDKFHGRRPLLGRDGAPLDAAQLDEAGRVAAILSWSALPGSSRHHWGSDCDVIDRAAHPAGEPVDLAPRHYGPGGHYARLEDWLARRAGDFGFFRPYDRDRGGVQPEPWHLSYAPVAVPALAALDAAMLERALAGSGIAGWEAIRRQLAALHARYVAAVAEPSGAVLAVAASGFSPSARPA
jgi:LAS superfamily LD-carboxypeptidase LdcB